MAAFTVHIPNAASVPVAPEKIIFLRDGFSWSAFFLGPLWLIWRRAWLAALLWTLALVVIALASARLGLPKGVASTMGFVLAVLLGFEGSRFVAWSLARKGYSESAVVIADDIDDAETVFFRQWLHDDAAPKAHQLDANSSVDERKGEAPSL
jgi:hypothetical protein